MPASELTGDGFERLWETAQAREREQDDSGAARAYTELLRLYLESGRDPNAYLLVRIARGLFRVELFSPAGRLLDAVRTQRVEAKDSHGVFRVDLRRCELALLSSNRFRAARVLARAGDARGPLGRVGPRHLDVLEQRLLALSWPSVSSEELAQARVDARVMLSRLWASSGRFLPAIEMLRRAVSDTGWRELVYRREELALLMVEHHLDGGDLASAEQLIRQHLEPREDASSWTVLQARLCCLCGRFSEARRLMTRVLGDSEQGALHDVLQASWLLAQCLLFLNRTREVEELLQRSQERLPQTEAGRVWAARFDSLRELMERRRRAAKEEWIRPFAPQEAADLRFRDPEPPGPGAGSGTVHGARPLARTRERFAEDWARLANQVMKSLEDDGASSQAIHALAGLERLAARTDSPRLVARTFFHEGLVAYYRGEFEEAKTFLSQAVMSAHTLGCVFDEWQALGFLAWTHARLGEERDYADRARRARALLDRLVADLDTEDRVFFRLNKWSAQDEYLAARVRALGRDREVPAHVSRFRRWRGRREAGRSLLEVYRALSCLMGWDVERRLEGSDGEGEETPSRASTPSQVEAWVRIQLQLPVHGGAGRAGRRGLEASRWPLWHIPSSVAVLHFYVMADRTLAFVLGQRRIELHTLPLSRERLWRCALAVLDEIRQQVKSALRGGGPVEKSLKELSSALGLQQLLGGLPSHVERLVIIPHDVLANLPFPALFLDDAHLCERFSCSLMPHLGWLSPWRHRRARPLEVREFLGVGVSTYEGEGLDPLPGAVDEPEALVSFISARRAVVLKDDEASRANVTRQLESAEWAHLACHGEFDPEAPHRSRLYLGREEGRSSVLSLAEVQRLRLDRLRLAVLASCWSSSASPLPGNELVCIPAAFLRAGSSAVVASLWGVDHVTATSFMEQLYAEIARRGVAAGLARVQRRWARASSVERNATAFWGGYVAYGNG
jgi:CHAT domain-containing protein/tetratricopeptide (TPR) repeat protein